MLAVCFAVGTILREQELYHASGVTVAFSATPQDCSTREGFLIEGTKSWPVQCVYNV